MCFIYKHFNTYYTYSNPYSLNVANIDNYFLHLPKILLKFSGRWKVYAIDRINDSKERVPIQINIKVLEVVLNVNSPEVANTY